MPAHRPMDSVRFIHRVLRAMLNGLEQSSGQTDYTNEQQVGALTGQFQGLNFMLGEHIKHEDELIFPLLDKRARNMVPNYSADHVGDREVLDRLSGLVMGLPKTPAAQRASAGKKIYREAIALNVTSLHHMDKEERILYPLLNEHTTDEEQWGILRQLYMTLPVQMFPQAMPGLMALLEQDEREEQLREFMKTMTPATFKHVVQHAPKGMAPADWQDLCRRIPELVRA